MSLELFEVNQLPNYDDVEEIQLMDTDGNNLQMEEQQSSSTEKPTTTTKNETEEERQKRFNFDDEPGDQHYRPGRSQRKALQLLIFDKIKLYIRDGPNKHHVETLPITEKFYDLPTAEQLASIDLTEEQVKEIWKSLNITEEDFRCSSVSKGTSRPESLYVRGVNNMSTQTILNYFEDFTPIGIEWVSDQSCNIFWYDTFSPLRLLAKISTVGPSIAHRRPVDEEPTKRTTKRKHSEISTSSDTPAVNVPLPPGHWREIKFQSEDESKPSVTFYVRYTTTSDRKIIGSQKHSEYYREYGNPNFDGMKGLISRTKKRELNALKGNPYWDFTVVKPADSTSSSTATIDDEATAEEKAPESNVKFTVVLPPKKTPPAEENEEDEQDEHRSKRQRRRQSPDSADEEDHHQPEKKTHFTVTIDPKSKQTKDLRSRSRETSRSHNRSNNPDEDDTAGKPPVTDARQILERKRRNRV